MATSVGVSLCCETRNDVPMQQNTNGHGFDGAVERREEVTVIDGLQENPLQPTTNGGGGDGLQPDFFFDTKLASNGNGGDTVGHEMVPVHEAHAASPITFGCMVVWQLLMLLGIALFTTYDDSLFDATKSAGEMQTYAHFQDVHVMIFIGFGFLMTFLRKYGYSAVGLNMFLAVLCIQWFILAGGFIHKLVHGDGALESKITINLVSFITGDFAAAVILITFGALIGKVSVEQLLIITFFEIIFFAFNEQINVEAFKISDMGGSVVVHTFGAYFGLAASWVLSPPQTKDHKENAANKGSDTFAMIGTIFLWMFWPSFNSALAGPIEQQRCIINTLISITGSCSSAFIFSYFLRGGKFDMVDVQNATLAGGVAIGTACNMAVAPGGALSVGLIAGMLSVVGYTKITPFLEETIGLYDTCGVHNLHGMPGVMAGIVGCIAAGTATEENYRNVAALKAAFPGRYDDSGAEVRTAGEQAGFQIGFLGVTLVFAIVSGLLTGAIAKFAAPAKKQLFSDKDEWECPEEDEVPGWFHEEMSSLRKRNVPMEVNLTNPMGGRNEQSVDV